MEAARPVGQLPSDIGDDCGDTSSDDEWRDDSSGNGHMHGGSDMRGGCNGRATNGHCWAHDCCISFCLICLAVLVIIKIVWNRLLV